MKITKKYIYTCTVNREHEIDTKLRICKNCNGQLSITCLSCNNTFIGSTTFHSCNKKRKISDLDTINKSTLQKSIEEKKRRINALETKISDQNKSIFDLERTVKKLYTTIDEKNNEIETNSKIIELLKNKCYEQEKIIHNLKQKINEYEVFLKFYNLNYDLNLEMNENETYYDVLYSKVCDICSFSFKPFESIYSKVHDKNVQIQKLKSIITYLMNENKKLNDQLSNQICSICKYAVGNFPEIQLNKKLIEINDDKLVVKVRLRNNVNSKVSPYFERFCAKLLHIGVPPSLLKNVLQTSFNELGIFPNAPLPSKDYYISLVFKYALLSDIQFYLKTKQKDYFLCTDECTKKFPYQVIALGTGDQYHVQNICKMNSKTTEEKINWIIKTEQFLSELLSHLNLKSFDENFYFMDNVIAHISDRGSNEVSLNNEIEKLQKNRNLDLISKAAYCSWHLLNTAVKSCITELYGGLENDPGLKLASSMIYEYYNNPRSMAFFYSATKIKSFNFKTVKECRIAVNIMDCPKLVTLLDVFKDFVEQEIKFCKITKRTAGENLLQLSIYLNSKEHLFSLCLHSIEAMKLVKPFLHSMKKTKKWITFYKGLNSATEKIDELSLNIDKIIQQKNDEIFGNNEYNTDLPPFPQQINFDDLKFQLSKMLKIWSQCLKKVSCEFKPGGKFGSLPEEIENRLLIVDNTNNISESVNSSWKYILRGKRSATHNYKVSLAKLLRNEFPSNQFLDSLSNEQIVLINKYVKKLRYEEKNKLNNSNKELLKAKEIVETYEKQTKQSDNSKESEQDDQLNTKLISSLKVSELDCLLKKHGLPRTGTKFLKQFRLESFLMYKTFDESKKKLLRESIENLLQNKTDITEIALKSVDSGDPIELDYDGPNLFMMDFESARRSQYYENTNEKRPGGREFYQFAEIELFSGYQFSSYCKRSVIEKIPNCPWRLNPSSPLIMNAPEPIKVIKAKQLFENLIYDEYENCIKMFWAQSNFDITMESDSHQESEIPILNYTYINALHFIKLLIPGLKSYKLDEVYKEFGFDKNQFRHHDALDDSIAAMKCLLFGIGIHLDYKKQPFTKNNIYDFILEYADKFDLQIESSKYFPQESINDEDGKEEEEEMYIYLEEL